MKKAQRITPPRIPKGEDPKVTIANQDRQIALLIDRIQKLERDNFNVESMKDHAHNSAMEWQRKHAGVLSDLTSAETKCDRMQEAYQRLLGWQDCAREVLGIGREAEMEPFPSNVMN